MTTLLPAFTATLAAGSVLVTSSLFTGRSWVCTSPAVSPAACSAARAWAWVCPVTSGTSTCAGPVETNTFTVDPALTCLPPPGMVRVTDSGATVLLGSTCRSGASPRPVRSAKAAFAVKLVRLGSVTCLTAVPRSLLKLSSAAIPMTAAAAITISVHSNRRRRGAPSSGPAGAPSGTSVAAHG